MNLTVSNLVSYLNGGLVYFDKCNLTMDCSINFEIDNSTFTSIASQNEGGLFYVNNNLANIIIENSKFTNFSNSDS